MSNARETNESPRSISVIVPCFNESRYIDGLLRDLADQDYAKDLYEVLFVDGGSTDGTVERIRAFARDFPFLHVLDNPKRFAPHAMNIGLKHARGELVAIIGAHAAYPKDYFSKQARWLQTLGADCVGGVMTTTVHEMTPAAAAIVGAMSHPFGVGNGYFRIGSREVREVDCAAFGCYRRDVFDRVGTFDERLIRNQDIEFSRRLKSAGGKIFIVPEISFTYFARSDFAKLFQSNFENGRWVVLTSIYTGTLRSLSLRHFIPLLFVSYLFLLPVLAMVSSVVLAPLAAYVVLMAYFSFDLARRAGRVGDLALYSLSFLTLHVSYGLGSLAGLFGTAAMRLGWSKA